MIGLGILVPALALVFAATRPGVRDVVRSFVTPLPAASIGASDISPTKSGTAAVIALPTPNGPTGGESTELQGLVANAGHEDDRGERVALFPTASGASGVSSAGPGAAGEGYHRPAGLRRIEIASRDDAGVDRVLAYFAEDARGHGALVAALKRAGRYRSEVERILRAWKIPEDLVAIAFVESGFSPTFSAAAQDVGAGIWSLPTSVARAYGLTVRDRYDERRAVALSTEASAHYLADLRERLGSWELAVYAFGAGYGQALAALGGTRAVAGAAADAASRAGPPDFWQMAADLPPEGRRYVFRVLAVATILANLDRLGFDGIRPDEPVATSDLEVPAGTPMGTVARAAGTSVERLHELNPEYLGDTVPDTGFAMSMHLPSGGLARAKELLMPLLYSSGGGLARQGDSRFDWGSKELPGRVRDAGDGSDAGESGPKEPRGGSATGLITRGGGGGRAFYRTADGDTLDSIAARFGVARETIASDNALDPAAGLRPGQLLTVRRPADAPPAGARPPKK